MKFQYIIFNTTLYILVCLSNIIAQYDTGKVIYSETNNTNLSSVLKNYIVADFDIDNYSDIVLVKSNAQTTTSQLTWYKGDESGNFSEQDNLLKVENGYKENEIFYTDMNEDGIDDIVFQNSNTGFTILFNDGQGSISEQIEIEAVTEEFVGADLKELADLDGDGDMDGVFFAKTDSMSFWGQQLGHCILGYNNGTGTFSNYSYLDNEDYSIFYQVETGDIDGDGDLDIVCNGERFFFNPDYAYISYVRNFFSFIRLYKNTGLNSYAPTEEIELEERTYFVNIKLQDINADGYDELLVEKSFSDINNCEDDLHLTHCDIIKQFEVFRYGPQNEIFTTLESYNFWLHDYTFEEETNYAIELQDQAFHLQFAHQNTDNNLDVLSVNVPQRRLQWHLGDGNGSFSNTQTVNINNQYSTIWPALKVADIDNDSDLDIFVLLNDDTSSTLTVFKNETPVSIDDKELEIGKISIAPNLVQGNSHVQLTLGQNQHLSKTIYNLYTVEGAKLITGNAECGRILVPDLPAGMYFVEVNVHGENYIDKLIVN